MQDRLFSANMLLQSPPARRLHATKEDRVAGRGGADGLGLSKVLMLCTMCFGHKEGQDVIQVLYGLPEARSFPKLTKPLRCTRKSYVFGVVRLGLIGLTGLVWAHERHVLFVRVPAVPAFTYLPC